MENKIEKILDGLYQNRAFYIRYFVTVIALSIIRIFLRPPLLVVITRGVDVVVHFCWAVLFFLPVKLWVFKNRCSDIFSLLTQIMKYIICVAVLWIARSAVTTTVFVVSNNTTFSLVTAGVVAELVCLALMINVVFKKNKKH